MLPERRCSTLPAEPVRALYRANSTAIEQAPEGHQAPSSSTSFTSSKRTRGRAPPPSPEPYQAGRLALNDWPGWCAAPERSVHPPTGSRSSATGVDLAASVNT